MKAEHTQTRLALLQAKDKHRSWEQKLVSIASIHPTNEELHTYIDSSDAKLVGLSSLIQDFAHKIPSDPLFLQDLGEDGLWLDASTHALGGANNLALLMALRRVGITQYEALIYKNKVEKFVKTVTIQEKTEDELQAAKAVDLIVLPKNVEGTNCGNCKFFKNEFCNHPSVNQAVGANWCCDEWDAKGTYVFQVDEITKSTLLKQDDDTYSLDPGDREDLRRRLYELIGAIAAGINSISEQDLYNIVLAGASYGGGELSSNQLAQIAHEAYTSNAGYALGFEDDMKAKIDDILSQDYTDSQALEDAIDGSFDSFATRAESYVNGGKQAWTDAVALSAKENGTDGCVWNCNFGPGSCADCLALHGQWMTWDEFDDTFGETICNGGCNCGPVPAANPEDIDLEDLEMEAA